MITYLSGLFFKLEILFRMGVEAAFDVRSLEYGVDSRRGVNFIL